MSLVRPLTRSLTRSLTRGVTSRAGWDTFSPLALDPLAWVDFSDISTLWQDTGATTPITTSGQTIARANDLSGNNNHFLQATAAARPAYTTGDGFAWAETDGVDDTIAAAFTSGQTITRVTFLARTNIAGTPVSGNTGFAWLQQWTSGLTRSEIRINNGAIVGPVYAPLYAPYMFIEVLNGVSSSLQVNNETAATGSVGTVNLFSGSKLGSGNGFTQGKYYGHMLFAKVLTAGQIANLKAWADTQYAGLLNLSNPKYIYCDGDSLTAGTGASSVITSAWPSKLPKYAGGNTWPHNIATGGHTLVNMESGAAAQADANLAAITGNGVLIGWGGTNDIATGSSLATTQGNWNTYFANRATAGWASGGNKLVAATVIARGSFTAGQQTIANDFNTWLRANYTTYATHLVDLGADARLSNSADATYYNADTVHLTDAGYDAVAELVAAGIA